VDTNLTIIFKMTINTDMWEYFTIFRNVTSCSLFRVTSDIIQLKPNSVIIHQLLQVLWAQVRTHTHNLVISQAFLSVPTKEEQPVTATVYFNPGMHEFYCKCRSVLIILNFDVLLTVHLSIMFCWPCISV